MAFDPSTLWIPHPLNNSPFGHGSDESWLFTKLSSCTITVTLVKKRTWDPPGLSKQLADMFIVGGDP